MSAERETVAQQTLPEIQKFEQIYDLNPNDKDCPVDTSIAYYNYLLISDIESYIEIYFHTQGSR